MHKLRDLTCLLPTETIKMWQSILLQRLCFLEDTTICCIMCLRMMKKDLNWQSSYATDEHRRENKERKSNRRVAESHRMNNDINILMVREETLWPFPRGIAITLMERREKTERCPQSIRRMMDLKCGVTSKTSHVTKSDSFPSVDWLQSDKHRKHHTHHRLAAKQINTAPPAHTR